MKKQLSDWVKQHSAKDYKECYRVLNYPGYTGQNTTHPRGCGL